MNTVLALVWSISRGRDTYGYNVVTLRDMVTGQKFRAMGGGYDLVGTVFGDWLDTMNGPALLAIAERAGSVYTDGNTYPNYHTRNDAPDALYGMTAYVNAVGETYKITTDGGCGLESMLRIAEAVGLKVTKNLTRRGNVESFVIADAEGK